MMLTASRHKLTMTKTHTKTNTNAKKRENFQEERVHVKRHSYSVLHYFCTTSALLGIHQSFAQFTMSSISKIPSKMEVAPSLLKGLLR